MSELHDRIIEISKKNNLAHVGSCLTAVGIIDEIYQTKETDEPFILSCGHCGLAHYVVNEKYYGIDAEKIFAHHGTHPERCSQCMLHVSTGSLGHGLGIALGMALADRSKNVYCLISDGEAYEGSIWEVGNVMRKYDVSNLKVYLNWNGWSAYGRIDLRMIENLRKLISSMIVIETSVELYGLKGLSAHYVRI